MKTNSLIYILLLILSVSHLQGQDNTQKLIFESEKGDVLILTSKPLESTRFFYLKSGDSEPWEMKISGGDPERLLLRFIEGPLQNKDYWIQPVIKQDEEEDQYLKINWYIDFDTLDCIFYFNEDKSVIIKK